VGASEDFARDGQEVVVVELDADDVLFDLDDDATLLELDAAHKELDRRQNAVPRELGGTIVWPNGSAHADAASTSAWRDAPESDAASSHTSGTSKGQLEAIASLRHAVSILHRNEVRAYAQALRTAIEQRLAKLPNASDVRVTVTTATTAYIRSAPRPAARPARIDVDQAIVDAIKRTPTPAALPGTLLTRAEAAHNRARDATANSCAGCRS